MSKYIDESTKLKGDYLLDIVTKLQDIEVGNTSVEKFIGNNIYEGKEYEICLVTGTNTDNLIGMRLIDQTKDYYLSDLEFYKKQFEDHINKSQKIKSSRVVFGYIDIKYKNKSKAKLSCVCIDAIFTDNYKTKFMITRELILNELREKFLICKNNYPYKFKELFLQGIRNFFKPDVFKFNIISFIITSIILSFLMMILGIYIPLNMKSLDDINNWLYQNNQYCKTMKTSVTYTVFDGKLLVKFIFYILTLAMGTFINFCLKITLHSIFRVNKLKSTSEAELEFKTKYLIK